MAASFVGGMRKGEWVGVFCVGWSSVARWPSFADANAGADADADPCFHCCY